MQAYALLLGSHAPRSCKIACNSLDELAASNKREQQLSEKWNQARMAEYSYVCNLSTIPAATFALQEERVSIVALNEKITR